MKPTKILIERATKLVEAREYVDKIKPVIEAIQIEVMQESSFYVAEKWGEPKRRIEKKSESYLMTDSDFNILLGSLHEAYKRAGFNIAYEYCPLLMAEETVRKAERDFIEQTKELQRVINTEKVLTLPLEIRKKYVDINLEYVLQFK